MNTLLHRGYVHTELKLKDRKRTCPCCRARKEVIRNAADLP